MGVGGDGDGPADQGGLGVRLALAHLVDQRGDVLEPGRRRPLADEPGQPGGRRRRAGFGLGSIR